MNREVIIKVVQFAMEKYGSGIEGDRWRQRMYLLSPLSIAKLYLKDFVEYEDNKRWCQQG